MIHLHQKEYYQAIDQSSAYASSTVFIEFMLKMILKAVGEAAAVLACKSWLPGIPSNLY
jgi:hypothetical protein